MDKNCSGKGKATGGKVMPKGGGNAATTLKRDFPNPKKKMK